MISSEDIAYIAGLFDGEGSIHFKRGPEKKKKHKGNGYRISNSLRLSMEITMTDKSVLMWVHEVLGVGTLTDKPRKGLRGGSIKNSFCIPFNLCLCEDKTFKSKKDLKLIFETCLRNINEKNIVFSCGSGVTACVLALAYSLINDKYHPCIYDGSWAEYGII